MLIRDNVYLLDASAAKGPMPGFHCYLVKDAEGLTLIDTSLPGRAEDILNEIKAMGFEARDLKRILLTHGDMDHVGNALPLQKATGCAVYASQPEIDMLTGVMERSPVKAAIFAKQPFTPPELTPLPEQLAGYQIIETPGHTKGHVCFLYEDVLFAGDACSTEDGTLRGPDEKFTENMELAEKSWAKAREADFSWICPCHGKPIQVKNESDRSVT